MCVTFLRTCLFTWHDVRDLSIYLSLYKTWMSMYVTCLRCLLTWLFCSWILFTWLLCAWLLCVRDLIFARNFQVFLENLYFSWNEFYFTSLAESKCSKCDSHAICEKGLCKCRPQYIGNGLTCEPEKEPPGRGRWINKITFLPAIVSQGLRKTFPSCVTAIRLMMLG